MASYPKIQIKRTLKLLTDDAIKTTVLDTGEPFYVQNDNGQFLACGNASSQLQNINLVKFVSNSVASKGIFYTSIDAVASTTQLQNESGTVVYPMTIANNVYGGTNNEKTLTTLLNEKQDALSSTTPLAVNKGGTGATTIDNTPTASSQNLCRSGGIATALDAKAPKASPALTGTPTAPTATAGTNTTQIATTAFVTTAVANKTSIANATNATNATNSTNSTKLYVNTTTSNTDYYILGASSTGNQSVYRAYNSSGSKNTTGIKFNGATGVLMGAAWNDFAELRHCDKNVEFGRCVVEDGKGNLVMSSERLQAGANIISDTYGMIIGPDEEDYKPIAVAGRVLAFVDTADLKPGDALCASEFGLLSKMTRREIRKYPDRIVGYVSEIPTYDTWNNVDVNGRIWVKVH